jgi:hypothetical protein
VLASRPLALSARERQALQPLPPYQLASRQCECICEVFTDTLERAIQVYDWVFKIFYLDSSLSVNVGMRVVGVSPIILARAFFLLWLEEPISGELIKEEHPLINRVIAKKSTASLLICHYA